MNSHAACCSASGLLLRTQRLAPPMMTPPSVLPSGLGRNAVPTSNLSPTPSTIPRRLAVESRVILIWPATKAFFVSSVLRPRLIAASLSTKFFHHSSVLTPASLFTSDSVAGDVRPFPLFTYSAPWLAKNCSINQP
ncbi:hypothetical protein D1872_245480 [compost metagenome]